MNKDISNIDKNGNLHGQQIIYYTNGNIRWITNYHHGKVNGYGAGFNQDKLINIKLYCNMNKRIYNENHLFNKQIEIKI